MLHILSGKWKIETTQEKTVKTEWKEWAEAAEWIMESEKSEAPAKKIL